MVNPVTPIAAFSATPTTGNAPLTVKFTDESTGTITSWLWDFGDGKTGTAKNPSHKYANPGTYSVSLTVTGPEGTNTKNIANYITVNPVTPVAAFSATPTTGNAPLTVKFTDESTGTITSWLWDFGDGKTGTAKNPSHKFTKAGRYSISLKVSGPGGENTLVISDYIQVKGP
jgi:PKD repeat protein